MRTPFTGALSGLGLIALAVGCGAPVESYTCASDEATAVTNRAEDAPLPPLAIEFIVPNVDAGLDWYIEKLGFELVHRDAGTRSCFGVVSLEGSDVLLAHNENGAVDTGDSSLPRLMVADVTALHARAVANGVELDLGLTDQDFGLREFVARDLFGFRLRFAQPI